MIPHGLDHQDILAARLRQVGIARVDAKVRFFQRDEPLALIVLETANADACVMNGR